MKNASSGRKRFLFREQHKSEMKITVSVDLICSLLLDTCLDSLFSLFIAHVLDGQRFPSKYRTVYSPACTIRYGLRWNRMLLNTLPVKENV
jgi:hypothetical protein